MTAPLFVMGAGLVAGYGAFGATAARYLYQAKDRDLRWVFVADLARFDVGASQSFRAPTGERIAVTRSGAGTEAADFIALSSTCPHLGCQVRWEQKDRRFVCPCHNGVFDPEGKAVSGPPADAQQALPRYELKTEKGLLYILVPVERLPGAVTELRPIRGQRPCGAGHDPCLDSPADEIELAARERETRAGEVG